MRAAPMHSDKQWAMLLNNRLIAECEHESHRDGALFEFEHPDMRGLEEIRMEGHDDVTRDCTKPEFIKQTRSEEMQGFRDMEVYEYFSHEKLFEILSDKLLEYDGLPTTRALAPDHRYAADFCATEFATVNHDVGSRAV